MVTQIQHCSSYNIVDVYTSPDINECALRAEPCDPNANCTNTHGSFFCTCNQGYTGNGSVCSSEWMTSFVKPLSYLFPTLLDIDECNSTGIYCDVNAECVDTEGSFNCTCKPGFTGDGFYCSGLLEMISHGSFF